jgi:hypothetical protein
MWHVFNIRTIQFIIQLVFSTYMHFCRKFLGLGQLETEHISSLSCLPKFLSLMGYRWITPIILVIQEDMCSKVAPEIGI